MIQVITTYCFYREFIIQKIQAHGHQLVDIVSAAVLRYVGLICSCPQMKVGGLWGGGNKQNNESTVSKQIFPPKALFLFSVGRASVVCVHVCRCPERSEKNVGFPVVGDPGDHELPNAGAEN